MAQVKITKDVEGEQVESTVVDSSLRVWLERGWSVVKADPDEVAAKEAAERDSAPKPVDPDEVAAALAEATGKTGPASEQSPAVADQGDQQAPKDSARRNH